MDINELEALLANPESENLEFKEAKFDFSKQSLMDYCAALANEGGGKLLLGVNNDAQIVGTQAFMGTHKSLSNPLLQTLRIRINVEELKHPNGRVLIFDVPSRPVANPIKSKGKYYYPMRAGSSLTEMDHATLKRIINETDEDFSASIVPGLTIGDLDPDAIQILKRLWARKANREDYLQLSDEQMLTNLGLLTDEGLNWAAVILLGKTEVIERILPNAEIIFEWRQEYTKTSHDFRKTWRGPFLKEFDDIWNTINARNIRFPFQEGFVQREIFAFNEKPIREAVLNAVTHRDYTLSGQSTFIKASPETFYIESPGGFPPGITIYNILNRTSWRNRRLAETLEKAGLVERSGQGLDDIFERTIRDGKGAPDFQGTNDLCVHLNIPAQVRDKEFIKYLEITADKKNIKFSLDEILELEKIREQHGVRQPHFKLKFLDLGIIEPIGKTRGVRYILSHNYYSMDGREGEHTRIAGITRNAKKELILTHLKMHRRGYMHQFKQALPEMLGKDITNILQELRRAKKIRFVGGKRNGWWELIDNPN